MSNTEVLVQKSLKYGDLIYEYFTLASKPKLTEQEADCLDKILQEAQEDPWLDFLIDEADHILAHELNLINEEFIQHQQDKLRKSIDRQWCEQVLQLIQEISKPNGLKKLQRYLQDKGLYEGAIDGELGSLTERAIERLRQECQADSQRTDSFDIETWSVC